MERKLLFKCSLSESCLAALNAISECFPVQISSYLLCLCQACWRVCCRNYQKGHRLHTYGVVGMWTALHNCSPSLINSPVSAETSSGSTRGTCINVHPEQWLLLQAQRAPSLMCNRLWSQTCIGTACWVWVNPTGCHGPPLLLTKLVLPHTLLRGDTRW